MGYAKQETCLKIQDIVRLKIAIIGVGGGRAGSTVDLFNNLNKLFLNYTRSLQWYLHTYCYSEPTALLSLNKIHEIQALVHAHGLTSHC